MSLVGIDPGWENLGLAVLSDVWNPDVCKFTLLKSATLKPSSNSHTAEAAIEVVSQFANLDDSNPTHVTIERYVSYGNVRSTHTEEITELIGGVHTACVYEVPGVEVLKIRAVDWKFALVKLLNKHWGFENKSPNGNLDKKFSLQAAQFLLGGITVPTDHEADAICLAAFPILSKFVKKKV